LRWQPLENLGVRVDSIPGNSHMERVDQKIVLPARVETFLERRREKGMPGIVSQNEAEVVVERKKNNNEAEK
jgi:hypothetical protein